MESLEVTGKTVEEAIELGLKQLGAERDEVAVVVVTEGRSGILGIGSEPARVRVTPLEAIPEAAGVARDILQELFTHVNVDAAVQLRHPEIEEAGVEPSYVLDITGEDSGLLIGRGGSALSSLQFLLNYLVSRRLERWEPVNVDVEGYRRRRHQSLKNLAQRLAERVKRSGRPFTLEPMPASERRIIHLVLSRDQRVFTESIGEGEGRKVSIRPQRGQNSSRESHRRR